MTQAARAQVTFDMVRKAALSLPDVTEGTAWRVPAFRTRGKVFLAFRKDLGAIVVRSSFEQRDEMIETSPETYFTTDHHRSYPWVLAHLKTLDSTVLSDLVRMGWRIVRGSGR